PGAEHERAMDALGEAIDDFVECPGPVDGEVDEGTRMMNRAMAAAVVVADLPAADAARVLALAAATVEETHEDGDGCLSMLVGESVKLQVMGQAFDMANLERDLARDLFGDAGDGEGDWDGEISF
ncbi:MAG: hypothetical protein OXI10_15115, partial [Gammaproteobacteria bacterium]|nr:hypothetical protein [Gammaproteobacteria bacterium]